MRSAQQSRRIKKERSTSVLVPISEISAGTRLRKDIGDIEDLAKSIAEIGLLHPIVLNEHNELIAGRRRIEAAKKLGWNDIPATIVSLKDIMRGEADENIQRKDFTPEELVQIDRILGPNLDKQIVKQRVEIGQETGGLAHGDPRERQGVGNFPMPLGRRKSITAKYGGKSWKTLDKAKFVVEASEGHAELRHLVDQMNVTGKVDPYYKEVKRQLARMEAIEQGKNFKPDGKTVTLLAGDFRIVCKSLTPNSIDCIITDPLYDRQHLNLLSDLVEISTKLLKPGGSLYVMFGQSYLPEVYRRLTSSEHRDLKYHWTICMLLTRNNSNSIFPNRVFVNWKPVIWLVKGKFTGMWHHDVVGSDEPTKYLDSLQQNPKGLRQLVEFYTRPGDTVLDPMMGTGSVGVATLEAGRRFTGIDISEEKVKIAKGEIAKTLDRLGDANARDTRPRGNI